MKKLPIRLVLILGIICVTGATMVQVYWVKKALQVKENNFDQNVLLALRRVADHMNPSSGNTINTLEIVHKVSARNFKLNLNDEIDGNTLEYYLRTELSAPGLDIDFSYSITNASTDSSVFKKDVNITETYKLYSIPSDVPTFKNGTYNALISFPTRSAYIGVKMTIWIFSSFILLIVIFFFLYTIFVILKQFRMMELQKDFINNMAHEFKTPISTMSISADVLQKPEIIYQPDRLSVYASIIKSETNRLKNQVDKLLQMARMERDRIELHLEEIDLHQLIQEVIPNFSLKLDEQDAVLHYRLDAKHHMVLADRVHLTNIIYNLLDNAVKYTDHDPLIELSTYNENDDVVLSVKDNGIGIAKEFQHKVFDKFFRVPTGNIHNVKGFGLGLHYLKLVVNTHKWKIKLESEQNKGSNFFISMPYLKAEPKHVQSQTTHSVG